MESVRELLGQFRRPGRLEWIGLRPKKRAPVVVREEAHLLVGRGIEGDRYEAAGKAGKRQVSLISAEHLEVVAKLTGHERVPPEWLRRNLAVSGINLLALRNARFFVGEALLEGAGDCDPCSRMEEALGYGGYNAMRGHGGILARVIEGGTIRIGDPVIYAGAALPETVLGAPIRAQSVPGCESIRLQLVDATTDLDAPLAAAWTVRDIPFWAFAWAAGTAIAAHLLAHPELVRDRRVVDFGAGSGIAGIAAAKAGAREVIAVDVDEEALAACRANGARNGVQLAVAKEMPSEWDVLLAADVLYQGAENLERLERWVGEGRAVLLGVPERPGVPPVPFSPFARVSARTFPDVDAPVRDVRLYRLP